MLPVRIDVAKGRVLAEGRVLSFRFEEEGVGATVVVVVIPVSPSASFQRCFELGIFGSSRSRWVHLGAYIW